MFCLLHWPVFRKQNAVLVLSNRPQSLIAARGASSTHENCIHVHRLHYRQTANNLHFGVFSLINSSCSIEMTRPDLFSFSLLPSDIFFRHPFVFLNPVRFHQLKRCHGNSHLHCCRWATIIWLPDLWLLAQVQLEPLSSVGCQWKFALQLNEDKSFWNSIDCQWKTELPVEMNTRVFEFNELPMKTDVASGNEGRSLLSLTDCQWKPASQVEIKAEVFGIQSTCQWKLALQVKMKGW